MAENSKIEWTHHTFNPWRGCTKISPGCTNCYAETMSRRNPAVLGVWGDAGTRVIASESYWKQPLKWNREAEQAGERRRVFCASLADVYERRIDLDGPRSGLFRLIAQTPHLDWLLLTKRPENISYLSPWGSEAWPWPANVWIGTTVENQEQADRRIPHLLKIPARVRFLSCEPLLSSLDLDFWLTSYWDGKVYDAITKSKGSWCENDSSDRGIDWVICGGESGPNARPMRLDWARSLRDQCTSAAVPFFFKQWGGKDKKLAGRELDGRTWDEFPKDPKGE